MPKIHSLLETALYVKDPRVAAEFYRRVFGFETLLDVGRLIALDVGGQSVLLLFQTGTTNQPYETPGGVIPAHDGDGPTHFAFAIDSEEAKAWEKRLNEEKVELESRVEWPGGAHSLYFRDPDGNLAELITRGFWRNY
jgi:catechol 2,3-dioxygenase-like lactoylglutathione lyase family enzyme